MSTVMTVTVSAGYRIHLGFYRFSDPPYVYGSLGASIVFPRFVLSITRKEGNGLTIRSSTTESKRIIENILASLAPEFNGNIEVKGLIKHHVGLGTRTRLTMAMLVALEKLGILRNDVVSAAFKLGVGRFSSVGIHTFLEGGIVIDSGRIEGVNAPPSVIARFKPPEAWRIIVVLPEGIKGLDESGEEPIMTAPMKHPKQKELYSALLSFMHSLVSGNFDVFASSLEKIQYLTGEYFSKHQGGIYCCEESSLIAEALKKSGASGIGQSSWGPVVYGFVPSPQKADTVVKGLKENLEDVGIRYNVWVSRISNAGHITRVHTIFKA